MQLRTSEMEMLQAMLDAQAFAASVKLAEGVRDAALQSVRVLLLEQVPLVIRVSGRFCGELTDRLADVRVPPYVSKHAHCVVGHATVGLFLHRG